MCLQPRGMKKIMATMLQLTESHTEWSVSTQQAQIVRHKGMKIIFISLLTLKNMLEKKLMMMMTPLPYVLLNIFSQVLLSWRILLDKEEGKWTGLDLKKEGQGDQEHQKDLGHLEVFPQES